MKIINLKIQKNLAHFWVLFFYILLTIMGLLWILLGNRWYSQVVPFYDSLTYQSEVEAIIRAYQVNGWGDIPLYVLNRVNAVLFQIVIALLAPVLPLSQTAIYVYLIPIHLIGLGTLFIFLRHRTNSLTLAFLGVFLYLSTTPFRILLHGILDQRLDFATASFTLILWCVALSWWANQDSLPRTIAFGAVLGLALLHRPISGVQILFVGIPFTIYEIWIAYQKKNIVTSLYRVGKIIFFASMVFVPWLTGNMKKIWEYYTIKNIDVNNFSIFDSFNLYCYQLFYYWGIPVLGLSFCLLMTAWFSRAISWKYTLIAVGLIGLPVVPLILSGSSNPLVVQISLAGVGFLPLILTQETRFYKKIALVFSVLAFGFTIWNLIVLAKKVNDVDAKERILAEKIILQLNQTGFIHEPKTYLSGFVLVGGGPKGLASIARLKLDIPLYPGVSFYQASEFNLTPKGTSFSEKELNHAITCALQKAYQFGGLIMLVEPTLAEEIQPQLLPHPFSHQLSARISKLAVESGQLVDTEVSATLEEVPVRFYLIKENSNFQFQDCQS